MLLEKQAQEMNKFIGDLLPALLKTLSDDSDDVVLMNIKVQQVLRKGGGVWVSVGVEKERQRIVGSCNCDCVLGFLVFNAVWGGVERREGA